MTTTFEEHLIKENEGFAKEINRKINFIYVLLAILTLWILYSCVITIMYIVK